MGRVEVLDKVKGLVLLPALEMATTQQVADFYGVGVKAINSVVTRHIDELKQDGFYTEDKKSIIEHLKLQNEYLEKRAGGVVYVSFGNGNTITISNRGLRLFPKRAILRVGMLLRDSAVAKEVM